MVEPAVRISQGSKFFGEICAFRSINLQVPEGQFLAVVGASGSGKTTVLRCVAGLERLSGGSIVAAGRPVTRPDPSRTYVFQDYGRSLFPWRRVAANVSFPQEMRGKGRRVARERALGYLELVGLRERADAYPWQLSGGMQQRVAIARALAAEPSMLLMDEPFGAVDAQTRMELQLALLRIWMELRKTVIFVTHDIDEALFLSDRIVVIDSRGQGLAMDEPVDLPRPRSHAETPRYDLYSEMRASVLRLLLREEGSEAPHAPTTQ